MEVVCHSHVGCEDAVEQLQLGQIERPLQLVVVEWDFSRSGAVQPGLHEGGPRVLQEKATTDVIFTDAPRPRKHRPATVVLHCVLPEEEVGEVADVIGRHKIWLCGEKDIKEEEN